VEFSNIYSRLGLLGGYFDKNTIYIFTCEKYIVIKNTNDAIIATRNEADSTGFFIHELAS
jgi:hypothetical protein